MKRFGKVAVLMGGLSAERAISLKSGQAVLEALLSQGVDAHGIDADHKVVNTLQEGKFDRAFIILHGRWGEDGVIQGALDTINLPYTGSGVLGSALAMDKVRSKQVWLANDLPTAKYRVLRSGQDLKGVVEELGLPIFVKPATEGSSIGVSRVDDEAELKRAWQLAAENDPVVLAESFIPGPELTVGILDGKALPIIRLQTDNDFYDYEAKYQSDDTQYICPAELSKKEAADISDLAEQAYEALGCSGWGRIDLMLDKKRKPLLLEANTVPGMTDHSLVPMAAKEAGVSFEQLVINILETSL